MILDVHISFQNYIQDFGVKYDNTSIVTLDDGSQHDALPVDPLTWRWYRYVQTDSMTWQKIEIDTAFHLFITPNAADLCNGEMILELEATCPTTGRQWSSIIPAYLEHMAVENICPAHMPQPGSLTAAQWRESVYLHSWAAPRIPFAHLRRGVVGDLDGNNFVNISDLLIFVSKFDANAEGSGE